MDEMYEVLSESSLDNIAQAIEYSPQSIAVRVSKVTTSKFGVPFGYHTEDNRVFLDTRAIIVWKFEKKVLEKFGLAMDDETNLPILSFFKEEDQVQREDLVEFNLNGQIRTLKVLDIKATDYFKIFRQVYLLAPIRQQQIKSAELKNI